MSQLWMGCGTQEHRPRPEVPSVPLRAQDRPVKRLWLTHHAHHAVDEKEFYSVPNAPLAGIIDSMKSRNIYRKSLFSPPKTMASCGISCIYIYMICACVCVTSASCCAGSQCSRFHMHRANAAQNEAGPNLPSHLSEISLWLLKPRFSCQKP